MVSSLISAERQHDEVFGPTGIIADDILASISSDSAPIKPTIAPSLDPTTAPIVIGYTSTMGTFTSFHIPSDLWLSYSKHLESQDWQATRSTAAYNTSIEGRPVRGMSRGAVVGAVCGVLCNVALCGAVYVGLKNYGNRMRAGRTVEGEETVREKKGQ